MASAVNICAQSLSGFHAHKVQIPVLKVATSVAALLMVVLVAVMALVASESYQHEQQEDHNMSADETQL